MSQEIVNPITQLIAELGGPHVTSLAEERRAARENCAVFPAAHRAILRAVGEDAESFLHGMLTNDVRGLAAGAGMPAAFLTDTGKVVSDLRLYRGKDSFDLDCVAWRAEHLCRGLDKYIIADDVEIEKPDGHAPVAYIEGPAAFDLASRTIGVAAPSPFSTSSFEFGGASMTVHAVSDVGGRGLLVVGPQESGAALIGALEAAGAIRAGLGTLDVLRVEAGVPWAGIDMDEDTLLMEIGLDETISRTKGCYLGQEVVERVSARGQVNRTLTAFEIDAAIDEIPGGVVEVRADEGAAVGRITSRVDSPSLDGVLGMGLLHRKGREAPALQAWVGERSFSCRVTDFPGRDAG